MYRESAENQVFRCTIERLIGPIEVVECPTNVDVFVAVAVEVQTPCGHIRKKEVVAIEAVFM